jgi:hypothetical protein
MIDDAVAASTRPAPPAYSPSPAAISAAELSRSLFKFAPTTLQTERYVSKPRTYPKGRTAEHFDKTVYMQASHSFVLSEDDPSSFLLPDHPVRWEKVELVICPVETTQRECPICLSPAVVAKITKCGHVYCATCLEQYFSQSEKNWSRCPLCFDSVYPASLKSAEFRVHRKFAEGDVVEFVLMRRYKDSVNAMPAISQSSGAASASSSSSSAVAPLDSSHFARIQLTTDISSIVQRELRELFALRETSRAAKDDFTEKFVDLVEANIVRRIDLWQTSHPHWQMQSPTYEEMKLEETRKYADKAREQAKAVEKATSILSKTEAWPELAPAVKKQTSPLITPAASSPSSAPSSAPNVAVQPPPASSPAPPPLVSNKSSSFFDADESQMEHRFNQQKEKQQQLQGASTSSAEHTPPQTPSLGASTPSRNGGRSASGSAPVDPTYYFYQSTDGQQLYLHALNFRSLFLTHHNSNASLPSRIRGRVVHKDSYVVDANVRGKFRFLSHLPMTANFSLALVDFLDKSVVSKEVHAAMQSEFAEDRKHRQQAAKKQRELNKRTIQMSKQNAASDPNSNHHSSTPAYVFQQPVSSNDVQSFPTLGETPPATGSPELRSSTSSSSPSTRGVQNWNTIAEKGMASSELWAPLTATPPLQPVASHWGQSAAPMARPQASGPPAFQLGATAGATWGRKAPSSSTPQKANEPVEEDLPPPTVNRSGQTTLLSTSSRRAYR